MVLRPCSSCVCVCSTQVWKAHDCALMSCLAIFEVRCASCGVSDTASCKRSSPFGVLCMCMPLLHPPLRCPVIVAAASVLVRAINRRFDLVLVPDHPRNTIEPHCTTAAAQATGCRNRVVPTQRGVIRRRCSLGTSWALGERERARRPNGSTRKRTRFWKPKKQCIPRSRCLPHSFCAEPRAWQPTTARMTNVRNRLRPDRSTTGL